MKRIAWFVIVFVIMAFAAGSAQGPPKCLPVASPTPNVNGIVATHPSCIGGSCDAAWAAAPYKNLLVIGPSPQTAAVNTAIFISSSLTAGKPDDLFLGIHVEQADQLSSADFVTLYFDTNADGTPEFALQFEVGPTTPITNATIPHTTSLLDPNRITYSKLIGASYVDQALPGAATLLAKVAYNFTGAGVGAGIWELELHVNIKDLGFQATTGKIGFGAKLYTSVAAGGSQAFDWPDGLTTDSFPLDHGPGQGCENSPSCTIHDPVKLDVRNVSSVCVGDVQAVQLGSNSQLGPNTFFRPTKDGGALGSGVPETLTPDLQTTFNAGAQDTNTGDTGDTSPLGGPNNGFVHFFLAPWGMGVPFFEIGSVAANIDKFGTPFPAGLAKVIWPVTKTDWNTHASDFKDGSSDHACMKVVLQSFPSDGVLTGSGNNDEQQINLSYTHASTVRDKILIRAPGTPTPGAPKEDYALRVRWDNVPPSQVKLPGRDKECWLHRLCDRLHHRNHWQTQFVNGTQLGIKPLPTPGYYGLQLAPGEQVALDLEFTGAVMPSPSLALHVSPGAGGQVLSPHTGDAAVSVPIPAGGMVTVVARGLIAVSPPNVTGGGPAFHNPNGFPDRSLKGQQFLLAAKAFEPWVTTGALIGAFKADFSDSFFIGTAGTFFAPPGATTLFLAVNDVAGQYGDNNGPGFDLNVVATPLPTLPTKLSQPANPALGLPGAPQPGANLPMLVIDLMKMDPVKKVAVPVGYVAYAVYASENGGGKPAVARPAPK